MQFACICYHRTEITGMRGGSGGVYILYDSSVPVYIGYSGIGILGRIRRHCRSNKVFDSFGIISTPGNQRLIERLLIEKFKPKYNTMFTEKYIHPWVSYV